MESGTEKGGVESPRTGRSPLIGGDLLAAPYAGYRTYAQIQNQKGPPGSRSHRLAEESLAKAEAICVRFNPQWWDASSNHYRSAMMPDHTYGKAYLDEASVFGLLFELMRTGPGGRPIGPSGRNRAPADQAPSYFPEVLFNYGTNESAHRYLLEVTDPEFRSWGIPEAVFSVVGAIATGLMGISPDAALNRLETLPRLPKGLGTVALTQMPVLGREVTVRTRAPPRPRSRTGI
jgi:hypothetical protein